jgi:hypothetical protein
VIGTIATTLCIPAFSVSLMNACRNIEAGRPLAPPLLFSGFPEAICARCSPWAPSTWRDGGHSRLSALADGGALMQLDARRPEARGSVVTDAHLLLATQIALILLCPLMMAYWYAPVLAAWHGLSPAKALFFSFVACARNWRAFLVYSLAILVVATLVPGLLLGILAALLPDGAALLTVLADRVARSRSSRQRCSPASTSATGTSSSQQRKAMPEDRRAATGNFRRHLRPGSFRAPAARRRSRRPSWLAAVRWIPAGQPALRAAPQVSAPTVWQWCAWPPPATRASTVDAAEVDAAQPSYTVLTLERLRQADQRVAAAAAGPAARCRRLRRPARLASLAVAARTGAHRRRPSPRLSDRLSPTCRRRWLACYRERFCDAAGALPSRQPDASSLLR